MSIQMPFLKLLFANDLAAVDSVEAGGQCTSWTFKIWR